MSIVGIQIAAACGGKVVELFMAGNERLRGQIGNPASGFGDYTNKTEL
jgi:hypothetical protein